MKFNADALSEIKSTHRRSDFTRHRRISHCKAIFHPPERVDLVDKSSSKAAFVWPARRDLNPRSSESESAALSNCATGRNIKFAVSNYSICHCKKQQYFVVAVFRTYGVNCLHVNKILMFYLLEY